MNALATQAFLQQITAAGKVSGSTADRDYWRDRFTHDEINEMAAAIWPGL